MAEVKITITASTQQAKAALTGLDSALAKFKQTTGTLNTTLINFNQGMDTAKRVLGFVKRAYDETAGAAVAYAAQVRDLNRVTGVGAEETSRLIQVADDLTISYEALEQAAKIAARNGIEFTTEKLAEMSAEYQALNPGQERAAYLLEKFGKNGLEMGKWMEVPTDKLIAMSDAIDQNMIMTEAAVAQAREFEIAQDNLADAVQGAKYAIGNELNPALSQLSTWLADIVSFKSDLHGLFVGHEKDVRNTAETYEDYIKETLRTAIATKQLEGASVNQAQAMIDGTVPVEKQKALLYKLRNELGLLSEAQFNNIGANQSWMDALDEGGLSVEELGDKLHALAVDGIEELRTAMNGAVGGEMEDFREKSGEIFDKMGDVAGQIEVLKGKKWLTKDQQTELTDLETEYKNLQTELGNTATAHEEAMARISYSMLEARLGIDGFTEAELGVLNNYAEMTGLIDEPTRMLNESISLLTTQWENGKQPVDNYMTAFEYLNDAIKDGVITADEMTTALDLLNGREINVGINVSVKGDPIPDFGIDDPDAPIAPGEDDVIGTGTGPYATGGYIPVGGRGVVGGETVTPYPGGGAVVNNTHNYQIQMGVQANENAVINRLKILEAFGI